MKNINKIIQEHHSIIERGGPGESEWYEDEVAEVMKIYAMQVIGRILEAEHQHNLYNGTTVNAVTTDWINKVKQEIS